MKNACVCLSGLLLFVTAFSQEPFFEERLRHAFDIHASVLEWTMTFERDGELSVSQPEYAEQMEPLYAMAADAYEQLRWAEEQHERGRGQYAEHALRGALELLTEVNERGALIRDQLEAEQVR